MSTGPTRWERQITASSRSLPEGGWNEPRDIDAPEHSGAAGHAQAQATSCSAHCNAHRLALDLDRSLYGRGRDRTRVPRTVHPKVDALPHSCPSRSRGDAQGAPACTVRILRSRLKIAALRWL